MNLIYCTIGCIVLFAILYGYIQMADEKMLSSVVQKIKQRKKIHSDGISFIDIETNDFKSFSFKKAILIVGLIYIINIASLFKTKKYEITSDGNLYRTIETYWGFNKKEYQLDNRNGKWYVQKSINGKFKDNWIELNENNEDFYNIEYEQPKSEWYE